jgi:Spy/CpxP family protein refolding chaperone
MKIFVKAVVIVFIGVPAMAASSYSEMTGREIKAVSPDRINDLRTGAGAGYALAAELNGYPGPRHVLDLADKLDLTNEQRRVTATLFERMKAEAIPLGKELLEQEASLDSLFRDRKIDEPALVRLTAAIGVLEARLRAAHLKYHLVMSNLLTPHQRAQYDRLRGYNSNRSHGRHRH